MRGGTRGGGGSSAALRWLGLPVEWLAWWGRWMCESVAAHYGDAPDDFVVADNVELPLPGTRGGGGGHGVERVESCVP